MANPAWPPPSGLSSVVVPRKAAVFSTHTSTRIEAPASLVYETVLHVAEYQLWNSFIPEVRVISQPAGSDDDRSHLRVGSVMTFMVVMDATKPTKYTPTELQVTDMSTPEQQSEYIDSETRESDGSYVADLGSLYRVTWKQHGGYASKGLQTERFHEIIPTGEKTCEMRTWEVYGGVLAYTVKWMYQKTLNGKFALWAEDLKRFAEEKSARAAAS